MLRIGIDCRFAGTGTGLARYTVEVTRSLLGHAASWTLFVRDEGEPWLKQLHVNCRVRRSPYRHYSVAEQLLFPRTLRHADIDLLFVPHFNAPALSPVPIVITVHDLILHRFPNQASLLRRASYRWVFRKAVRRAKKIVAVSDFVRHELMDSYGSSIAGKTRVVGEGVDPIFSPRSVPPAQRPYFLYVGNAKQHKNVPLLIEAFTASERHDADLLLVSGGPEVHRLSMPSNVRVLEGVSDVELVSLYSGAEALVTASLYEGYCLPVAEALACGCPVVASRRGAIPELLDGRGSLIEPTLTDIARAFRTQYPRPRPYRVGDWTNVGSQLFGILQSAIES
jgi:glycosyltransferase involved in cell wall biosynthesis